MPLKLASDEIKIREENSNKPQSQKEDKQGLRRFKLNETLFKPPTLT